MLKDGTVTVDEIKKAHRKSALIYHPDKNLGKSGIEEKFNETTRAYKVLLDYYHARNQSEEGEGYCVNKDTFGKNAVLVTTME